MMGLPIEKLIVATNENDVLDEFFKTGVYRARKAAETLHTSSPSMDISKASNFERFVFDWLGRDGAEVAKLFKQVDTSGGFDFSNTTQFGQIGKYGFVSGRSTHEDRIRTIQQVASTYNVVIDTHTADGMKVALEHLTAGVKMLVLETALPIKFASTIEEALGHPPGRPSAFEGIEQLPQQVIEMPPNVQAVKQFIVEHTK